MPTRPFFIAFYRQDVTDIISGSLQGGIYFRREETQILFWQRCGMCVYSSRPFLHPAFHHATKFNSQPSWFMTLK